MSNDESDLFSEEIRLEVFLAYATLVNKTLVISKCIEMLITNTPHSLAKSEPAVV